MGIEITIGGWSVQTGGNWKKKRKKGEENFNYWKKTVEINTKWKKQHNTTWQNFVNSVEKLFDLHIMDSICPSKCFILKNYKMFHPEIESDVLQSSNGSYKSGRTLTFQSSCQLLPNITVLAVINFLAGIEIWRAHTAQFLPYCWFFNCFTCHIVSLIDCNRNRTRNN